MSATVHELHPDVFTMRADLARVLQLARARRVGPEALLALTITKVLAATEPTVTTDIGVGGRGSLNSLVALVGPSGAGKGVAETTATEQIIVQDHNGNPIPTPVLPFGSGEGIASAYRPRGTDPEEQHLRTRVIFSSSEIDKVTALSSRTGSTLSSTLREAFMGEMLGAQNATTENSNAVPRHTYRFAAVLGVQPRRSAALLGEQSGGTPQRVLWARVGDPQAPRRKPADPGPLRITLPRLDGDVQMNVHHEITADYDQIQQDRLHVDLDGDDIDGHTRLVQLKVAAALALMESRTVIGVVDWEIAGMIVDRSTATRDEVQRILDADRKVEVVRRAEERAEGNLHADDHREREARKRVRDRIITVLSERGETSSSDLYKAVRHNLREHFDPVITELIVGNKITVASTNPDRYKLS
ncbi:hypothetical protein G6016_11010 [Dietzia aerolata]|uniref:Uncharacterized protein n=1 Tax=Dietzia aerolata TaxID=595984 RepID=A0ABV5JLJ2_9ACTN|nr:hypothetical protein [Dietzia aerolata]MBB0969478.1 hypothetical protein [Dietzia aerolata]